MRNWWASEHRVSGLHRPGDGRDWRYTAILYFEDVDVWRLQVVSHYVIDEAYIRSTVPGDALTLADEQLTRWGYSV